MDDFSGKTIIIRGGGKERSMGYAVAEAFARARANLVLVGTKKSKLDGARELIDAFGSELMTLRVADESPMAIERGIAQVIDRFGRIDVLVNCALVAKAALLEEVGTNDLERSFGTCTISTFSWMQGCREHLARAKGTIINFSSKLAVEGTPAMGLLAAASGGIEAITMVAAAEWGHEGVSANVVRSCARTAQFDAWAKGCKDEESRALELLNRDTLSKDFDDIARTCLYLASESGHHVTGQVMDV